MPYVKSQGVRIHYRNEGEGEPLVLQHGFTSSSEMLRRHGYTEALKNDYQVISIDARGHGASDKPHNPEAYRLPLLVGDVLAVMDELMIDKTHFLGYSRGGRLGFAMAKCAPERVHSFILGGSHPYAENFEAFRDVAGTDPEAFLSAMEKVLGEPLAPEVKPLVLANDLKALVAAACPEPSIDAILPKMTVPCLLFAGTADSRYTTIKECVGRMPNATFFALPGLNHVDCFTRIDLILPRVRKFLKAVRQF